MAADLRLITEIRGTRGSAKRTIYLDGEPWRPTHRHAISELGLTRGASVEPDAIEEQLAAIEPRLARERAYRLLGFRDRTASEIARRLSQDGFPDSLIDALVQDLIAAGLIDDARFASALAPSLLTNRGYGRARALRELVHRGVPKDLAQAALDAASSPAEESARAAALAIRLCRPGDTPERLAARLVRRGFATSTAFRAARDALHDEHTDYPDT